MITTPQPAGIFDAPALMNTPLMDSSLGVDMNSLMMIDAQLNATMAQAFTVKPITVFPDSMLSGATAFGTPMFDPATNGAQPGVAAYGNNMQQLASTTQAAATPPTAMGYSDTMSIESYGNAMSQIAGYGAAAAQVGMNAAVYSAQMQGAAAATQAQGQATMDYMDMMA